LSIGRERLESASHSPTERRVRFVAGTASSSSESRRFTTSTARLGAVGVGFGEADGAAAAAGAGAGAAADAAGGEVFGCLKKLLARARASELGLHGCLRPRSCCTHRMSISADAATGVDDSRCPE
jgi:hypothetical protein